MNQLSITDNKLRDIPNEIINLNINRDLSRNCFDCSKYKADTFICTEDSTKENKCSAQRCGKISENEIIECPKDQCCSSEGYCGTDDKFCFASKGCQPQYGICKCGNKFDKGACSGGHCCSNQGYCGITSEFCATSNCQIKYGFCAQNNYTCEDIRAKFIPENDNEVVNCEENDDGYVKSLIIENKSLTEEDLIYIFQIASLESLILNNNELESIPKGVKNLSNLNELSIIDNKLKEVPSDVVDLKNLSERNIQ
ncbi:carbohydrate-binding module family 18 protein [Piromyces sp. E2]|nr:carbohydrate-binding module family 18 protein [Piromyces sp. E2]|eukprot:OUM56515.1 carbohydrate-binding module family 18 protein [Piromyces sp. E2]